jgi:tetratricopeptide (TPR) repeat protein
MILKDLGVEIMANATSIDSGPIELLAGEPKRAEGELRGDYEVLASLGETYFRSSIAALLAESLEVQERDEEAEAFAEIAESLSEEDDLWAQATWRSVRALLLAKRGEHDEAIALSRAAVELLESTDAPIWRANAARDYAEVLRRSGRLAEAETSLGKALELYKGKGSLVAAALASQSLDRLTPESSAVSRT